VLLVHLAGDYETIHGRAAQRQGHFFDPVQTTKLLPTVAGSIEEFWQPD
jgi:gluconate kinase